MAKTEYASPLVFPAQFAVKAMGKAHSNIEQVVLRVVQQQFPEITEANIKRRLSKDDNYLAVTIVVQAENRDQLDAIYYGLSEAPEVIIAF